MLASINPATGETVKQFSALNSAQIEEKLAKAVCAFERHRRTSFAQRAHWMNAAAQLLDLEKERLARIITLEMGKLLRAGIEEVTKCARGCRFYAGNAERFLANQNVPTDAVQSYVRHEPIGALLAIMPWNFPFWQVFRFAAPGADGGQRRTAQTRRERPAMRAGHRRHIPPRRIPEGEFQTLLIGAAQIGSLIDDPRVKAVTLTGSERAGSQVAAPPRGGSRRASWNWAAAIRSSSCPGADLERADRSRRHRPAPSTPANPASPRNDSSCRIEFTIEFELRICGSGCGPLRWAIPLIPEPKSDRWRTEAICAAWIEQVHDSIAAGARLLTGGKRVARAGYFYAPTVLADIPHDSPAGREEIFGPVACFFRASDAAEAIEIANDSSFGLGASAWTNDPAEQQLFISSWKPEWCSSTAWWLPIPRLPFGGNKALRLRPRARRGRDPRIREHQDRVDRIVPCACRVILRPEAAGRRTSQAQPAFAKRHAHAIRRSRPTFRRIMRTEDMGDTTNWSGCPGKTCQKRRKEKGQSTHMCRIRERSRGCSRRVVESRSASSPICRQGPKRDLPTRRARPSAAQTAGVRSLAVCATRDDKQESSAN